MLNFDAFYDPLGDGKTFGEGLLDWWITTCGTSHSSYEIWWHYGLSIIGDPMINFYHCVELEIKNKIIIHDENYEGCDIKVDNVTILNNADVIIDARNNINIIKDFEARTGTTLEIK